MSHTNLHISEGGSIDEKGIDSVIDHDIVGITIS